VRARQPRDNRRGRRSRLGGDLVIDVMQVVRDDERLADDDVEFDEPIVPPFALLTPWMIT
jgi:hypothetical protein